MVNIAVVLLFIALFGTVIVGSVYWHFTYGPGKESVVTSNGDGSKDTGASVTTDSTQVDKETDGTGEEVIPVKENDGEVEPTPVDSMPDDTTTEKCEEIELSQSKLKSIIENYLRKDNDTTSNKTEVVGNIYVENVDNSNSQLQKNLHVVFKNSTGVQESRKFVISLDKVTGCEWKVTSVGKLNSGLLKPICLSYNDSPSRHHLFNSLARCNEAPFSSQGVMNVFKSKLNDDTKPYCVTWGKGKPSKSMIYQGESCGDNTNEFKWYNFYAYDKEMPGMNTTPYCVKKLNDPNRIVLVPNAKNCENSLLTFYTPN